MKASDIDFKLSWLSNQRRLTTAELQICIDNKTVWPALGEESISIEIQIDDLLSYLTEFWKPLLLRQVYPIAVNPDRPSLLRATSADHWANLPREVAEREIDSVNAFEEAHDVSKCFGGLFGLTPFWMLRSGKQMLCETTDQIWLLPFEVALDALTRVGDLIACRLEKARTNRWSNLLASWRARDIGEPVNLLAWSAGLPLMIARQFADEGVLSTPQSVSEAANDDDELRIAARMAGTLPPEQIRTVIELARGFDKITSPQLDDLSAAVSAHISDQFADLQPFAQGEAIAAFLREKLDFASVQFFDIFAIVNSFDIHIEIVNVEPPTLDGLAIWGPKYGPGVLINEGSRRIVKRGELYRNAAARITLAHEFCHLLIDRTHALSAVDILNSRMPRDVERRAKAFAGELLLPGRVAADIWIREGRPSGLQDLDLFIKRLTRTYGITRSVAAWKLEHGLHRQNIDLSTVLDIVVPMR